MLQNNCIIKRNPNTCFKQEKKFKYITTKEVQHHKPLQRLNHPTKFLPAQSYSDI